MKYLTHLVECQCILPQYKNYGKPIFHKFPVFTLFKEENNMSDDSFAVGNVIEKYVKCNNCDCVHRVYDICKSELLKKSDDYVDLVTTLDDLKFSLTSELIDVLSKNNADISDFEKAAYLYNKKVSDTIMLSKKIIGDNIVCKFLIFEDGKFTVRQDSYQKDLK